ncbi:MAG: tol-pal system-associated acyl-CoA thioesterase [Gammaproteobacteria bacterium]|nr:tol-pal system-associated acyl-CoA thioesterase [Gammaproteobacteria bacterium]
MKFSWPVRVYYEDTDSGGVVYYANYLKFFERARTEFLRQFDLQQDQLIQEHNIIFAVRNINVDYHKPAVFNDLLKVTTEIIELKKASIVFKQIILRDEDETMLCQATCKVACIQAKQLKPTAIPEFIAQQLGN